MGTGEFTGVGNLAIDSLHAMAHKAQTQTLPTYVRHLVRCGLLGLPKVGKTEKNIFA